MITFSDLKKEEYELNSVVFSWPQRILPIYSESEVLVSSTRKSNEDELNSRRDKIISELDTYIKQLEEFKSYGDINEVARYLKSGQKLMSRLDSIGEKIRTFNREEELMGWQATSVPALQDAIDKLLPYQNLYQIITDFQYANKGWMDGSLLALNAEAAEESVTNMWRSLYTLGMTFDTNPTVAGLVSFIQAEIERFKVHLPLIRIACNPGLRDRHWSAISDVVGLSIRPNEYTSISNLIEQNFESYLEQLEVIGATASKELSFEKALQKMLMDWKDVEFILTSYRDTGTYILSAIDDIQTLLDDHIVKTQTMRGSPFIKPFEEETRIWESKLITMQEGLDEWLKVQSTWLYLEPIFSSEDIMRQMPTEGKRFQSVNKTWREVMGHCNEDRHVLQVFDMPQLVDRLKECNVELEQVQKGLNQYLEVKRLYFPRFFFLSNDEMLEILSETRDPMRVQPHLKKCFEGIASLKFEPNFDITGMYSSQKEYVKFNQTISVASAGGAVEKWLLDVEKVMVSSLRDVTAESFEAYMHTPREKWVLEWAGQVVLCVSQIFWTNEVEQAIQAQNDTLKKYVELSTDRLNRIVDLVRGNLSKLARSTLEALVVIDVHARDVVHKLAQDNLQNTNDFGWLSQLRYYFNKHSGVTVKMVNSTLNYGYEYLGNTGRLVITPLTDRCYRTLFGALQLNLGGAPEGPAGTGKTESVKDLAKALAMFCVVFNCSDGLDYLAMGKFFKGLASAGAWACFDEFNRIDLEVLSVVAQQILTIQRAKFANAEKFNFEGTELRLNPICNCFITMNRMFFLY